MRLGENDQARIAPLALRLSYIPRMNRSMRNAIAPPHEERHPGARLAPVDVAELVRVQVHEPEHHERRGRDHREEAGVRGLFHLGTYESRRRFVGGGSFAVANLSNPGTPAPERC